MKLARPASGQLKRANPKDQSLAIVTLTHSINERKVGSSSGRLPLLGISFDKTAKVVCTVVPDY
jgi:hypothetical protein